MAEDLFIGDWFPYYFRRFEGSDRVALMSLAEEGAYHRAIRIAWQEGSVPANPKTLAAKIQKGCTPDIAIRVLESFVPAPNDPDRMINPTVEEIREAQEAIYLSKRMGGKLGAEIRWGSTKPGKKAGYRSPIGQPKDTYRSPISDQEINENSDDENGLPIGDLMQKGILKRNLKRKEEEEGGAQNFESPQPKTPNLSPHSLAIISLIEDAFQITLDSATRNLAAASIPEALADRFPTFIRARAVGALDLPPSKKLAKIGYAITDFLKDNKGGTYVSRQQEQSEILRRSVAREEELFRIGMEKRTAAQRSLRGDHDESDPQSPGSGEPATAK